MSKKVTSKDSVKNRWRMIKNTNVSEHCQRLLQALIGLGVLNSVSTLSRSKVELSTSCIKERCYEINLVEAMRVFIVRRRGVTYKNTVCYASIKKAGDKQ